MVIPKWSVRTPISATATVGVLTNRFTKLSKTKVVIVPYIITITKITLNCRSVQKKYIHED
jgi:hypothetical protein